MNLNIENTGAYFAMESGKHVKMSQAQALFEFYKDSKQDVLFIKNLEHQYIQVNHEFEVMLGRSAADIIGKTDHDLLSVKHADHFVKMDVLVCSEKKSMQLEEYVYYPDGSKVYFETIKLPLLDDAMEVVGVIGLSKNINDKKIFEQRSVEKEHYLSALINGMDMGLAVHEMIYDASGRAIDYRFVDVNPYFEKLIGKTRYDILGKRVLEIFPETESYWIETYGKVAASGEPMKYENYSQALDRTFSVYAFSPQVNQFAVLVSDITQQKKYEEHLFHEKLMAEELSMVKDQFLANMSHEIRTPLNGITGLTELILMTSLTPEQKAYTKMLKQSSEGLMKIIDEIMEYSRLIKLSGELMAVTFSIKDLMEELVNLYQFSAQQKGIHIKIEQDENSQLSVVGDRVKLRQILSHLLANAIKFTQRGEIQLKVICQQNKAEGFDVEFAVLDTGVGIADAEKDKIFKAFEQGDQSMKKTYQGVGIGLATVSELCKKMSGSLLLTSELGVGTLVRVTVPLKKASPATVKTILIVEDDQVSGLFVEMILKKLGYGVSRVETATRALQLFKETVFDLILTDLQIPEMDGFEMTVQLKASREFEVRKIPIIALTGYGTEENKAKALIHGMDDFVVKPVDQKMMKSLLEKHLE